VKSGSILGESVESKMVPNYFKKQTGSIKRRFNTRRRILKPFVERYKKPVLVHSLYDANIFYKILKEGKIKPPSKHTSSKKTPYMEKLLKTDNGIYYSLGFQYLTSYDWKFGFIFDLDYLKELKYFNKGIHYKAYTILVNYWYENDREYLDKFTNFNKLTKEVMDVFYTKKYKGKVRKVLEFWKVEKELYSFFENYSKKKEPLKLIKEMMNKSLLPYPASKKHSFKIYTDDVAPELLGKKDNNLLKNPYFLGFCVAGKVPKKIQELLKKNYSNKILFDGEKIFKVESFDFSKLK